MSRARRQKQGSLLELAVPPRVEDLVEQFLQQLRIESNASRHTLVNYEIDLRHWIRFLLQKKNSVTPKEFADLKNIRAFVAKEGKKYSRTTVNRRLSVVKGFLKFLHREGHIKKNVAKLVSLPKPEEKLPRVLKPEEVLRMIEEIPRGTLRLKRIRAMVELFYSTGIRLSELVQLDHGDLDFRRGTIRVLGKGDRERQVPMGRHCQNAIRDYIDAIPTDQKDGPQAPLFLNREGERLSARTVQRNLAEVARQALGSSGLDVSPHTLRHSCATHLLSAGAGLREIQEFLGHESLVTTQKYTQVDLARLKASYQSAHPRSQSRPRRRKKELSR